MNGWWLCKRSQLQFKYKSGELFPSWRGVRSDVIKPISRSRQAGSFHNEVKAKHLWGRRQHSPDDKRRSYTLQSCLSASANKSGSETHIFSLFLFFFSPSVEHTRAHEQKDIWFNHRTCLEAFHGEMWPEEERENSLQRADSDSFL